MRNITVCFKNIFQFRNQYTHKTFESICLLKPDMCIFEINQELHPVILHNINVLILDFTAKYKSQSLVLHFQNIHLSILF